MKNNEKSIQRYKRDKKTSSNIQQHKRTSSSHCTLLFTRIASAIALAPSSPNLLLLWETFRARKEKQNGNLERNTSEKTSSSIQQHKRTRSSLCTLLFTRIASAIALAPSAPKSLLFCETFRVKKLKKKRNIQRNKSEKTSSSIQQHTRTRSSVCTLLFTRIASATALAPTSLILLPPCETFRARK